MTNLNTQELTYKLAKLSDHAKALQDELTLTNAMIKEARQLRSQGLTQSA